MRKYGPVRLNRHIRQTSRKGSGSVRQSNSAARPPVPLVSPKKLNLSPTKSRKLRRHFEAR